MVKNVFTKEKAKGSETNVNIRMTLGKSLLSLGDLEKVIQLMWWQDPMRGSPSQLSALGSFRISDQEGSWIRMMSNWEYDSSIVLVTIEFF